MPPVRLNPSLQPPYDRLALSHKVASFPCSHIGERQPLVLSSQLRLSQVFLPQSSMKGKGKSLPKGFFHCSATASPAWQQLSLTVIKPWSFPSLTHFLRAATHSRRTPLSWEPLGKITPHAHKTASLSVGVPLLLMNPSRSCPCLKRGRWAGILPALPPPKNPPVSQAEQLLVTTHQMPKWDS